MPEFSSGSQKVATVKLATKPAGLQCFAELSLVKDSITRATSGAIPFVSTGSQQSLQLPITMPTVFDTYKVWLDIETGGFLIGAYQGIEDVNIVPAYKVSVSFRRERACEEGYMLGDTWVCTRYSPSEREGFITVINEGALGRFTTIVEGWFYLSGERGGYIFATPKQWADNFEMGQTRVYQFPYLVPITGMPLDSRFFIKVYDPDGNTVADKVFITTL